MKKMQNLASNYEIIDFWPLFSKSCAGFKGPLDGQYSIHHFEHFSFTPDLFDIYDNNVSIGFGTNTLNTITVKATYYFVKTTGPPFFQAVNKWLPECGTSNVNDLIPFSFSLHIRENNELSILENEIENLKVYPNPTDGNLYLTLSHGDIDEIVIFDVHGRKIHQAKNESNTRNLNINIEAFHSGLYIVQVISKSGNNYSSKFIKK
jgi:hypothetical protein